ncbi:MAG: DNA adenine methylase [Spirochaetia bacterium]|nr:DNA adenine methylase [Spirochaetia bacterium]
MKNAALKYEVKKPKARPFLKWVGGKRQLLPEIERLMPCKPEEINCYYEPFLGGGAVFFSFNFNKAVLADNNSDLINVYKTVQNNLNPLIKDLKKHKYEKEYYYGIRDCNLKNLSAVKKASRLIYLNKTCYNGLYRVNSRGVFNVPFGSYKKPLICDEENLILAKEKLKNAKIMCAEYHKTVKTARKNDFVYFDPPYEPISSSSNFVSYVKEGFSSKDQEMLSETFKELTLKGVKCMLSNSNSSFVRKLYKGFNINKVKAARFINSAASKRGKIEELIITNY